MTTVIFSLIIVLLLEQLAPLPVESIVTKPLHKLAAGVVRVVGHVEWLSWSFMSIGLAAIVAFVSHLLHGWSSGWLAFPFASAVLYLTLGFRHESHFFTDIHLALRAQNIERARAVLAEWTGESCEDAKPDEVARLAIERALVAAHRCVFGVIFWFALLGPGGAVLYRVAHFVFETWDKGSEARLGAIARRAFIVIDWIPVRVTALLFAVGGNFEDAVLCWRSQAVLWPDQSEAVLVTSGAGALGVRLTDASESSGDDEPAGNLDIGVGNKAIVDNMQSAVGLVWRALLAYLVVLSLTTIAVWVSG